jgi:hypothetical protein
MSPDDHHASLERSSAACSKPISSSSNLVVAGLLAEPLAGAAALNYDQSVNPASISAD